MLRFKVRATCQPRMWQPPCLLLYFQALTRTLRCYLLFGFRVRWKSNTIRIVCRPIRSHIPLRYNVCVHIVKNSYQRHNKMLAPTLSQMRTSLLDVKIRTSKMTDSEEYLYHHCASVDDIYEINGSLTLKSDFLNI